MVIIRDLEKIESSIDLILSWDGFDNEQPSPKYFRREWLFQLHSTIHDTIHAAGDVHRAWLDGAGFVLWFLNCTTLRPLWLKDDNFREFNSLLFADCGYRGVLINLARDWEQISVSSCV